jgi:hypothetical protein
VNLARNKLNNQGSLIQGLDFAHLAQVSSNPIKHISGAIAILVFATPQPDQEFYRIPFAEPLGSFINVELVICYTDVRTQPDFLDGRSGAVALAFFLLVLKLTVVQNFGNWGVLTFRNDDEVKPCTLSNLQRFIGIDQTTLVIFVIDQKDLRRLDLAVNQLFLGYDGNFLLSEQR